MKSSELKFLVPILGGFKALVEPLGLKSPSYIKQVVAGKPVPYDWIPILNKLARKRVKEINKIIGED